MIDENNVREEWWNNGLQVGLRIQRAEFGFQSSYVIIHLGMV